MTRSARGAIFDLIQPETQLETLILEQPVLQEGMLWGKPRRGHPEGKVLYHVREVLDNIDQHAPSDFLREQLRLVAIIHDSFKYQEDLKTRPRNWAMHHAVIARRFADDFINDEAVLDVIEWHDEAYYCWRAMKKGRPADSTRHCIDCLMQRMQPNRAEQLYALFYKCDTQTGDKTQAPLYWFEEQMESEQYLRNAPCKSIKHIQQNEPIGLVMC